METNECQYRINLQIEEIQNSSFPFALRISHKPKRTKLCVQIYPSKKEASSHPTARVYFSRQQKWQSNAEEMNQVYQLRDIHSSNQPKHEEQLSDEVVQQPQLSIQKAILFDIIIYHGIYPYEAPFVTITKASWFPGPAEFKNYFYDVMQVSTWWPTITIKQILSKLPNFAYLLKKKYSQNTSIREIGNYPYNYPFFIEDIREYGHYFLVMEGMTRYKKQSTRKIVLGLTSQYLLILIKKEGEAYFVDKKFKTCEIIEIAYKKASKRQEISIVMCDRTFLLATSRQQLKISTQERSLLYFYLKYYEVIKMFSLNKEFQSIMLLVQALNELIELADMVNHEFAIQWASRQLRQITKNFINS